MKHTHYKLLALASLFLLAAACSGELSTPEERPWIDQPTSQNPKADRDNPSLDPDDDPVLFEMEPTNREKVEALSAGESLEYMRKIAPMIAGRSLSDMEIAELDAEAGRAIIPMLQRWTSQEEGFREAARMFIHEKLSASGQRDDIDFELPANLAEHLVEQDLPYSNILDADYCVDRQGNQIACDTGAPYNAGVLTTRAFLASNTSRFNLRRASTMLNVFACRQYPMEADLQPPIDKPRLIPMFQANSFEEQAVEAAKSGFGNGEGCYTCHGQFSVHAQLYVKFDEDGLYHEDASGQQDPDGELGRSYGGLYTSHLDNPAEAEQERSQVFGEQVANLREAARVMAVSDVFMQCATRNVIGFTFGLSETHASKIDRALLAEIAAELKLQHEDPTFAQIVVDTLSHHRVIKVILDASGPQGEAQ